MKKVDLNERDMCLLDAARRVQRAYGKVFSGVNGEGVLDDLKQRFGTDLPCFQGKRGEFDPLDAMRRDAYREVVLYIEEKVRLSDGGEEQ